ncbi:AT-rich interactive domain-containing protein 2 isoform X2 [Eupeodes corollae]|uniref:AT-rich interactive domain-containing protein 2 isoform X2 n=1 Tax=Eupeodes corollae TaxID=290404 RepID=UPI002493C1F2|nr:AT-rich interactive domain-containing protein 2 isoform X2 [Eupeodes corollae]
MSTTELIQSAFPLPAQSEDSISNCKTVGIKRPSRTEPAEQDRGTFFRALQSFHESRNTPITRLPKINGQEVDLYVLYNEVTNRGGWLKVNIRNEWNELVESLGFQPTCVNAAVAIKSIYTRYLDKYERLHFLGEDPDKNDDLDDDGRPKKWSSKTYNSIPMTYNYKQHELNEEQRNANRMSEDLYKASEYDRLLLSLISPLPNEQDFAINVCTLMSNESKHTLKLDHCPKLLDALLAHAGVFCHYSMRELFQELYSNVRKHSLQTFWKDLLYDKPQILELSFDDFLTEKNIENSDLDGPALERIFQDGLNANSDDAYMRSLDFLSLGPGLGTQEYIGQRIHQVSSIIRNLSFYEENTYVLAKNRTFVRFLVMGANIRWGNLHHMVLDMFGNIANELDLLDPTLDELTRCLMSTICEGIESSDRGVIISCLEVLYKICQQDSNEEPIHKCLDQKFYNTLCLYLSLNDIMLLLYTLEAIYALSSLGHKSCSSLVQVKGIINSLVSLITVEAQSYGPDGCILMRVVETVPGNMLPMVAQNIANIANLQNAIQTTQPPSQTSEKSSMGRASPAPNRPNQEATPTHGTKSPVPTNQDHENFALSWLSATFEPTPSPDSRVEQHELYRMYLSAIQKCGRRGIVSHTQFPRMVRTIFGAQVVPNYNKKVENPEGTKEYYICIRVRSNPLPIQMKVSTTPKGLKDGKQKLEPGSSKKSKKKIRLHEQMRQEQLQKSTITTPPMSPVTVQKQQQIVNTPSNQPVIVKSDMNVQQSAQQTQVTPQASIKQETQIVNTPLSLPPMTPISKNVNPNMPQILGNVLVTPSNQATIVQQAAKPIQITTIAEQPQMALQQQIQLPTLSQAQTQPQLQPQAQLNQQQQQIIVNANPSSSTSNGGNGGAQPSSSLVKSLLANKVAQRQQKQKELAAQQHQQQHSSPMKMATTSLSAVVNNPMMHTTPIKVGQTTIKPLNSSCSDKKTTIITSENSDNSNWDPIPPLAPLSSGSLIRSNVIIQQQQVLSANDDSSSASMASSIISSSQIEGDGSFASFEGLLMSKSNKTVSSFGIDDDSSKDSLSRGSKDSVRMIGANQMLVDLLDKKALEPPMGGKRKHDDDYEESDEKKILLEVEPKVTASKNAANLYAEMAASILEDEDLEEEQQVPQQASVIQQTKLAVQHQQQQPEPQNQLISVPVNVPRQLIMNPNNPNQMILSQGPQQQSLPTATATIKTDQGLQTVPCILQKNSMGQQILQPMMSQQQQPQTQTQYVLATNPQGQTYLVAQQTTQPQPQTQRLLVTQTPQQQAAGTKTIIILQQQGQPVGQQQMINTSQPQKVIMTTSQGQQMIVTQMARPVQHQIYMNTAGTNVIQTGPIPVQQQMIQKQITNQSGNANILSQLSHIPATIKIHQTSSPMVTSSIAQSITTTAATTSLPRLGKSVSIVQQQGVPPPQTQMTPAVMQTQIVQHTGTPGGTEKRQVIISSGRTIEYADSQSQQGSQVMRMIQPATTKPQPQIQQVSQAAQKVTTAAVQKPAIRPGLQIQQQSAAITPAPVKIPTPPPPPPAPAPVPAAAPPATSTPPPTVTRVAPLKPKPEVKVEVKAEIKDEPKTEKTDDDNQVDPNWLFVCDWRNCPRRRFKSIADLHHHTCLVHCPEHLDVGAEIFCQWGTGPGLCDGIPRKRFSLMTHILDRHLTIESLRGAVQRRLANGAQAPSTGPPVTIIKNFAAAAVAQQQAAESTRGTASPALSTSSNGSVPSTGSAALHAIKRHASDFINPKELMDENEGPVTKSIRLTAALILRNLVTFTPLAKRTLRQYEPHLASVALSNVESSGTISQILYELNN